MDHSTSPRSLVVVVLVVVGLFRGVLVVIVVLGVVGLLLGCTPRSLVGGLLGVFALVILLLPLLVADLSELVLVLPSVLEVHVVLFGLLELGLALLVALLVFFDLLLGELLVLFRDELGDIGHFLAGVLVFDVLVHLLLVDEKRALRAFRRGRLIHIKLKIQITFLLVLLSVIVHTEAQF